MKTNPVKPAVSIDLPLTIVDEVLFILNGGDAERRVLLSTAVLLMAQCSIAGLFFDLLSLHHEPIARFRDGVFSASPLLIAAVEDAMPAVESLMASTRELTLEAVRNELLQGASDAESPSENPQ